MRIVQRYKQNGKWITRVYTKLPGRPKGVKSSTYFLSKEGRRIKQNICRKLQSRLYKEGRTGWPKGRKQSKTHRRKNSIGVRRAIREGRFNPVSNIRKFIESGANRLYLNHGKRGKFYSKKNDCHLCYDSSWELERMHTFEKDPRVRSYRRNPLQIRYTFNGQIHYTWPDFLVIYTNGLRVIEEIKPYEMCVLLPRNRKRIKAMENFCSNSDRFHFRLIGAKTEL